MMISYNHLVLKFVVIFLVREFREQREKFLRSRDLKITFKLINKKTIIGFLRKTGLYKLI